MCEPMLRRGERWLALVQAFVGAHKPFAPVTRTSDPTGIASDMADAGDQECGAPT